MKSPTESHARDPRPVRPALLAALVLAPVLAASAALSQPLAEGTPTTADAPSPANLIGSLEGLPAIR